MSDNLAPAELESALERIVRNQLAIKELEAENELLKGFFKTNEDGFPVGQTQHYGKFYVKVTKNARVDDKLASSKLSLTEYQRLAKTTIDASLAKRYLSPERYEQIQKVYAPKIEVGLV